MKYDEFLKNKSVLSGKYGFTATDLNKNMFDFQEWIVKRAIEHGRYAIFADTGLGKTLMQLSWADAVWTDINSGETLKTSKEQGDEKHMTPTQLEPLRRCIELYSDPDEIVFSPFNGVGSEGVVAIQKSRKYIGVELKTEYFKLSVENLLAAEITNNQISFL